MTGLLAAIELLAAVPDSLRLAYSVSGTVTDARTGRPVESAHVFLPDLHFATVTNAEGYFVLKSTAPVRTFSVSCVGYATATVTAPGDAPVLIGTACVHEDGSAEAGFALGTRQEFLSHPLFGREAPAIDLFRPCQL